jgi:exodeoxyribonuclease-3
MLLATWNVNSVKARLPRLLDWLADKRPDVVCLQETKQPADGFPFAEVGELGYEIAHHGEGRWNGVALLSRVGLDHVTRGFKGDPGWAGEPEAGAQDGADAALFAAEPRLEARAVGATCAGVRVWSVYVPNGRTPDSPHYQYKLRWLEAFRDTVAEELASGPFVVCGDFNVAPTDADVWDPALFVGSTHVTGPERAALAELLGTGLHDVIPKPMKGPNPFTYWDYRAGNFHQDKGMRIDLVYASADLAGTVQSAYIDREARKGKGPSDHAPVLVDFMTG